MVILSSAERRGIRPPEKMSVSQWAGGNMQLPDGKSARAGKFSMSYTPPFIEPANCLSDPMIKKVVLMTGTQVGKSTVLIAIAMYLMDQDPSPTMLVMPTIDQAKSFCQERIKPVIEQSPNLNALMTGRKTDYRNNMVATNSMELHFAGANSETGLISRPIRNLLLDEVDAYPGSLKDSSDPVSIVLERIKSFFDAKVFMTSTPRIREGLITREFLAGDQREYMVPCPECGRYQQLIMAQLKWPSLEEGGWDSQEARAAAITDDHLAHYECIECEAKLTEKHKMEMLTRGVWCPKGSEVSKDGKLSSAANLPFRSYHLGTLCSSWVPWSENASELIRCGTDHDKLRNFKNSWEGLPWEERVQSSSAAEMEGLVTDYLEDEVNEKAVILTAGVDVQGEGDVLYYTIDAWAPGMDESWRVKIGFVEEWEDLARVLFKTEYGGRRVDLVCVDSGHDHKNVMRFCRTYSGRARAVLGRRHVPAGIVSTARFVESTYTGKSKPPGQKLWLVDTTRLKDEIFSYIQWPEGLSGGWHLYSGIPADYFRHMCAEHKVRPRKGEDFWAPVYQGRANHWLDCEVYSTAAAHMRSVYSMKTEEEKAANMSVDDGRKAVQPEERVEEFVRKPFGGRRKYGRRQKPW